VGTLVSGPLDRLGRRALGFGRTAQGILAFTLITLSVALGKLGVSSRVIGPLVRHQIHRAGWRLLPMAGFVAFGLGLIVIGQTIALLSRVGAGDYVGVVMVTVVVRELGPLVVALLVLARVGAAHVIELGTARALGEVEGLEALGIDPIHYLVLPRVVGMALAMFSLTIYFILAALAGGYAFAFVQNLALTPAEYLRQLAVALTWEDFVLLALKTCGYGVLIAAVTCYQGLARPLQIEDVSSATARAVVQSVVGCVLLDVLFIGIYLQL
jgi:phospholipid/cholesterol/gamma-HCH transport system permease protein